MLSSVGHEKSFITDYFITSGLGFNLNQTAQLLRLPKGLKCKLYEPRHEKTNILVSDQVRYKSGRTATEDG